LAQRLLDQLRSRLRERYFSKRTEQAYVYWTKDYIRFLGYRHPADVGPAEIQRYLSHLVLQRNVAPNTQKAALNALVFLYTQVLDHADLQLGEFVRASKERKLPVVLERAELQALFAQLTGASLLCARIMYGSGLRVMEVVRLRVHDVDAARLSLLVRDGKGRKQRITTLAESLLPDLSRQLTRARLLFDEDRALDGWPGVFLPDALARKYPSAPREWGW